MRIYYKFQSFENDARFRIRTGQVLILTLLTLAGACKDSGAPRATLPQMEDQTVTATTAQSDEYVRTPAGLYHKSCVHEIPIGARVNVQRVVHKRDGKSYVLPTCNFPSYPNVPGWAKGGSRRPGETVPTIGHDWIEWTTAFSSGYKNLAADWVVPAPPEAAYLYSVSGRVYYTFPGLQTSSQLSAYIIQPVLQYGNNQDFGGQYWTIASWRCGRTDIGRTDCLHGPPLTVSPGDQLHGEITANNCSNGVCDWSITTEDLTSSQQTTWTAQDTEAYTQANSGAVEVYDISYCTELTFSGLYSNSGVFYSNVSVLDSSYNPVSPDWNSTSTPGLDPSCRYKVTFSATTANLYSSAAFSGSISGPTSLQLHQSAQYTAAGQHGTLPYQYQWRQRSSPDGFSYGPWSPWTSPSSQNNTFFGVNGCGIRRVNLETMITDGTLLTAIGDIFIGITNPC